MPLFRTIVGLHSTRAPCGVAAARAMNPLGVRETMQKKLPASASIAQAYRFAKAKAEPGFVALPRLTHGGTASRGLVSQGTYDPLRQHAVPLEAGSRGRRAFVDFLNGLEPDAGTARHGYAWQAGS